MAKEEKNEEDEGEEKSGGGGMLPIILGGLSVLLNIAVLVYLILFPSGGDGAMVEEMSNSVRAIHSEVLPGMSEQLAALAPDDQEEDDDEGDEEEEEEEGDEEGDEFEEMDGDGELSEISMMLTDTQLILRQLAENLNTDTASIDRKSVV